MLEKKTYNTVNSLTAQFSVLAGVSNPPFTEAELKIWDELGLVGLFLEFTI